MNCATLFFFKKSVDFCIFWVYYCIRNKETKQNIFKGGFSMKNSLLSTTLYKSYHNTCKTLFNCIRNSKDITYSYGYVIGNLGGLYLNALNCGEWKLASYIDSHNEKLIARYKKIMGK